MTKEEILDLYRERMSEVVNEYTESLLSSNERIRRLSARKSSHDLNDSPST